MKTLLAAAATTLFLACGTATTPASVADYFPKDNAVGAYVTDTTLPGLQVAKSAVQIEGLIDGDATPFLEKGALALGWNRYVAGTYKLDARVWQMKSATNATETFDSLVASASLYKANTWTTLAVGGAGRIADTGSSWWVNARKGAYIIEVKVTAKDATSRSDVEAFALAIAAKMP